jgi:hypothetical protein
MSPSSASMINSIVAAAWLGSCRPAAFTLLRLVIFREHAALKVRE